MRFSLDLGFVLRHMCNEYDDELEDYGDEVVDEVMSLLLYDELKLEISNEGFLVLDVPNEVLERRDVNE